MATPPADKIAENVTAASSPASCEKSATADADALTDAGVMPWCCQVDRTLGVGAFGVVWSATDGSSGRRSAVKKLTAVFANTHSARRAYRELMSLTSLRHDNLLSARGFVLAPDADTFSDIYIISELMDTDLYRIIISGQPLANSHIQLFMYQILRGLKYLHSAGIVHRDIKPANMLVNADCRLKIGDFGLACGESTTTDSSVASVDGDEPGGTLPYAAPELLLGLRAYASPIDIWSAGCLLCELLTRRVLFLSSNARQQLEMVISLLGSPQSLEDFLGVPDWARRYLMQKMTSSNYKRSFLSSVLPTADAPVVHLLTRLLAVSPRKRMTATQALSHAYVAAGRRLYHNTLCTCCRHERQVHKMDSSDSSVPLRGNGNRCQLTHNAKIGDCTSIDEECRRQHQLTADTLDPVSSTTQINIEPDRMSIEDLKEK